MDILLVLIPLSIALMALAVGAFVWAARDGQFDALDEAQHLPPDEPRPVMPSRPVIPSEARDRL